MSSRGSFPFPAMNHRGSLKVLSALARGDEVTVIDKGGGMACVISLGVYQAIADAIGKRHFKGALLASGGACNFSAFESDREGVGSAMNIYRHIACGGFLKLKWSMFGPYPVFDREELIEALKGNRSHLGLPSLNERRIKESPTRINIVVTDHSTGEGVLCDARDDLFASLRATISIPGVCQPVPLNGREVSDGAIGMRKVSKFMEMRAKYVLVIMNHPPPEGFWEWYLPFDAFRMEMYLALWHRNLAAELRKSIAYMDKDYAEEIRRIEASPHVETLVIYPTVSMSHLCSSLELLDRMNQRAREYVESLIEKVYAV